MIIKMKEQLFPIEIKSTAKVILCGRVGAIVDHVFHGEPTGLQRFKLGVQRIVEYRREGNHVITVDWYTVQIESSLNDEDGRHPRKGDIVSVDGRITPYHINGTDQYLISCDKITVYPKEEENVLVPC